MDVRGDFFNCPELATLLFTKVSGAPGAKIIAEKLKASLGADFHVLSPMFEMNHLRPPEVFFKE